MNIPSNDQLLNNNNGYTPPGPGPANPKYSYDFVRNQIDGNINVGGSPIHNSQQFQVLQVTGATGSNQELFNQVQSAIEYACGSEGPEGGPLCAALAAGQVASQPPFNCMIDLIQNYSNCGEDIPKPKREAAFKVFSDVTGYKSIDIGSIFTSFNRDISALFNLNAFYMFVPVMILFLIIIWLMVGFRWMNWVLGLFFTVLVIVVLYGFSILYRVTIENYVRSHTPLVQNELNAFQENFENSIAYWPQGLFAAACAVTCNGSTGCWACNRSPVCPPCNNPIGPRSYNSSPENTTQYQPRSIRSRQSSRHRNNY